MIFFCFCNLYKFLTFTFVYVVYDDGFNFVFFFCISDNLIVFKRFLYLYVFFISAFFIDTFLSFFLCVLMHFSKFLYFGPFDFCIFTYQHFFYLYVFQFCVSNFYIFYNSVFYFLCF